MNMEKILLKHLNSDEKWILAIPVAENGVLKLRVYMRRKNDLLGTFSSVYTYVVDVKTLADFYAYKSIGQAYNELIKHQKKRTGFLNYESKETGVFMLSDIKESVLNGKREIVCKAIEKRMEADNKEFTIEKMNKEEKEERKRKLEESEEYLMNLGYNY